MKKTPEELYDIISLAEMLNTRFCHDMAGPVSACNNGLEFLFMENNEPEMYQQAKELLTSSAHDALARLQVYRMAYGRVAKTATTTTKEIYDLIERFYARGKFDLEWQKDFISEDERIDNEIRRVLVNMILLIGGLLIYDGVMNVSREKKPDGLVIKITGTGPRVKIDDELVKIMSGSGDWQYSPHNTPAYFLLRLVEAGGVKLSHEFSETKAELIAEYKS